MNAGENFARKSLPMNIENLRRKARDGSLEVEHLLEAAAKGLPGLSEELARLTEEQHWQSHRLQSDGSRVVPLRKWAQVVAAYSSDGFEGLRALATRREDAPFVLGLIETLRTPASVSFALELADHYLANMVVFEEAALCLARSFNLLLSFKDAPTITSLQAEDVQRFLFKIYPYADSQGVKAVVLLALRGVGDREALKFVESVDNFAEPWAGTKDIVIRTIWKRIKSKTP